MEFRIPFVTDELLQYLERLYPDKAPEPDHTDREIWMKRGEVGVLRHLRRIHEEQRRNMLTGEIT